MNGVFIYVREVVPGGGDVVFFRGGVEENGVQPRAAT